MKSNCSELLGAMMIVLLGCGSIYFLQDYNAPTFIVPIVFGSAVAFSIYMLNQFSEAHFNPAVTFGFFLLGEISLSKAVQYVCFQTIGGVIGAAIVSSAFSSGSGTTLFMVSAPEAFAIEVLITFLLMGVILLSSLFNLRLGGVFIGCTVALNAYWAGPLTGASMNPARSLGPAVIDYAFQGLWVYLFAPVAGAAFATYLFKVLINNRWINDKIFT